MISKFVTMSQEKSLSPFKGFLLLLMGIVFLLMAGGGVLHALGNAVGIAKFQLSWQPSTCSIVSGDVRQTKNQHYEPTIDFTYETGGVLYKSSSLYPPSISFGAYAKYTNYQEAEDWLLAFPATHTALAANPWASGVWLLASSRCVGRCLWPAPWV